MKAIEIDDAIRRDPGLFSAVERATKRLEEEIGPSAESVSVEWKLFVADQILPTIRLRISDWTGSAMTHFQRAIIEKMTESARRIVFVRLWGDLLQDRSHRQIESLKKMVQRLDDGIPIRATE